MQCIYIIIRNMQPTDWSAIHILINPFLPEFIIPAEPLNKGLMHTKYQRA